MVFSHVLSIKKHLGVICSNHLLIYYFFSFRKQENEVPLSLKSLMLWRISLALWSWQYFRQYV